MTVQRSDENDKNIERVRVSVCDLVRTSLILHHQLVGIFTGGLIELMLLCQLGEFFQSPSVQTILTVDLQKINEFYVHNFPKIS